MADKQKGLWTNHELLAVMDPVLADAENIIKTQQSVISRQASSLQNLKTRAASTDNAPDAEGVRNMCELAVEVGVARRSSVDRAIQKMQEDPGEIVTFATNLLHTLNNRQASVPSVAETVPEGQHQDNSKGKTRKASAALREGAEAHRRVKGGL